MYKNIYIRICGIKKINSAKFVRLSAAINIKQKNWRKKNVLLEVSNSLRPRKYG